MSETELLSKRVGAAAKAGWWTMLLVLLYIALQWSSFLAAIYYKPAWLLSLLGGGELNQPEVHKILLYFEAAFELIMLVALVVVVWMSIWARKLKRAA